MSWLRKLVESVLTGRTMVGDRMPTLGDPKKCVVALKAHTNEFVGVFETLDSFMEWRKTRDPLKFTYQIVSVNRPLV